MANAQEKPRAHTSTVSSCSATECSHNEDRQCHAGEITVEIGVQGAACATYSPEKPKARP